MGNKNVIEINGKKYDAVTGAAVNGSHASAKKPTTKAAVNQPTGVVDGFKRPARKPVKRTTAKHAPKSNVQKSKTLHRASVNKPTASKTVEKVKKNAPTIEKSHLGVSARRAQAAKKAPKSQMVQKFSEPAARSSVVKKSAHLPVKAHTNSSHKRELPKINAVSAQQVEQTTTREQLIEEALANATSHEQKHVKQKNKRRHKVAKKLGISSKLAAGSTMALALILLGGFFAVQNVPNIAMRVAATRAGFDAKMPGYNPSGFSFNGPINYSTGQVTISFGSNTDDREYSVTQKSSNWNSEALLANFVEAENKQYQTYLDRGRTLYIYDGSNATWVDNGIWYQVEGDSNLTADQLVRIAASI